MKTGPGLALRTMAPQKTDVAQTYSKRAAMKRDLQMLNQRLEYYVGVNKRQSDDYQRMCSALSNAEGQFNTQMGVKNQKIDDTQRSHNEIRATLESEFTCKKQEAESACSQQLQLQQQHSSLQGNYVQLDVQTRSMEKSLGETASQLRSTEDSLNRGRRELSSRNMQEASLRLKLTEVKNDCSALNNVINQLDETLNNTRGTFAATKKDREQKITELGVAIDDRKEAQRRLEATLRDEFQQKLERFVGDRTDSYEQKKVEWLGIFRDEFNKKVLAFKAKNVDMGKQIRDLYVNKHELLRTILDRKSEIATLTAQRRSIESDISAHRQDFEQTSNDIRNTKAALARKDQEFDELCAAKVKLEAEIGRYRQLLDGAGADSA